MPISLDVLPEESKYPLDVTPIPVDDDVSKSRAARGEYSLGGVTGKTYDDIYRDISGGHEDIFRADAAAKMDFKANEDRQKALSVLSVQQNGQLSLSDVNNIFSGGRKLILTLC